MWIKREITENLRAQSGQMIQIVVGPRQAGKSSLLQFLGQDHFKEIQFDDMQLRNLAQTDPALFLYLNKPPLNLDEVQYVPNLFPELKRRIDEIKKEQLFKSSEKEKEKEKEARKVLYRMTGSNLILLSKNVRETLVGRAEYFYLNTLSVSEIRAAIPESSILEILFKGGWPELYTQSQISAVRYLNDYISNYVHKEIAQSAGIEKQNEFNRVMSLLAARVGQLINFSDIARDSGVKSVTVKEWLGILNLSQLSYSLAPFESNLNKRLIKSPKIYFWDLGIVTRLQGWSEMLPMQTSPYIGGLFENLVLSEILKFRINHLQNWPLFFWRTKEGEEIDFLIEIAPHQHIALEAKWSLNPKPVMISKSLQMDFPELKEVILVVPEGEDRQLTANCRQLPIDQLTTYLKSHISA